MLKYKIPQIVTLTQKSHRISNFLLHQIAYFCGQYINKKPLKYSYFSDFHDFPFCKSGATSNRNRVDIALSFSKLYLCYDVSPLNKVFTALHRSTQVCILGTISECKDRYFLFYLYNYRVLIFALSISYINKLAKCNFCIASIFVIDIFSCALGFLILSLIHI